ncbi:MAG: 1,4-alpha-glucan branching protein GlgB [Actinomycetota bacterium]|nr:1,4-alpha-glucan branching protein GlgB [Actinomycetota bacterium]
MDEQRTKRSREAPDASPLSAPARAAGKGSEARRAAEGSFDQRSILGDHDLHLFNEGTHLRLGDKLGAHLAEREGVRGANFAAWAPNARAVSVVGDFNGWDKRAHSLKPVKSSGIWEEFVPGVVRGERYKFHIVSRDGTFEVDKADPFATFSEVPPATASVVWDLDYQWGDHEWMAGRGERISQRAPISIYELHLGSWVRTEAEGGTRPLTYRELAPRIVDYVNSMGFTHVELLPVMEHPLYASWGYQVTGYFAPTSRYGTPQDFMYLVDHLHRSGIGVILDWVPSHFPTDEHGLGYFDGTHLYEHQDPRKGFHPDWTTFIFNYGRNEVRSFLLSSAVHWLRNFHADALRVDGVASMLYLDYSRKEGEWIPNRFGGRENLEAITFLRRLNEDVYREHPDVQTMAEESTDWPMASRPTDVGGLGFGYKWDLGWMHDTLKYMQLDPIHRRHHHREITFRMLYAFSENFVLPLSHDEVTHGKRSLLGRMPGDEWQRFANLRLLFGYMFAQPGKKLLFMGGEFGQSSEWRHDDALDWHLLQYPVHAGVKRWYHDLNQLYRAEPSLHELDCDPGGFEWIAADDSESSVICFLRRGSSTEECILAVFNFTPVPRIGYRIGVAAGGRWTEVANSDAEHYGGSGVGNLGGVDAEEINFHGRPWSIKLTLPPLACLFLKGGSRT